MRGLKYIVLVLFIGSGGHGMAQEFPIGAWGFYSGNTPNYTDNLAWYDSVNGSWSGNTIVSRCRANQDFGTWFDSLEANNLKTYLVSDGYRDLGLSWFAASYKNKIIAYRREAESGIAVHPVYPEVQNILRDMLERKRFLYDWDAKLDVSDQGYAPPAGYAHEDYLAENGMARWINHEGWLLRGLRIGTQAHIPWVEGSSPEIDKILVNFSLRVRKAELSPSDTLAKLQVVYMEQVKGGYRSNTCVEKWLLAGHLSTDTSTYQDVILTLPYSANQERGFTWPHPDSTSNKWPPRFDYRVFAREPLAIDYVQVRSPEAHKLLSGEMNDRFDKSLNLIASHESDLTQNVMGIYVDEPTERIMDAVIYLNHHFESYAQKHGTDRLSVYSSTYDLAQMILFGGYVNQHSSFMVHRYPFRAETVKVGDEDYVLEIQSIYDEYLKDLAMISQIANTFDKQYISGIQGHSWNPPSQEHGVDPPPVLRSPSPAEMRCMTNLALGSNSKGVMYYRWATNPSGSIVGLLDHDDKPTDRYWMSQALNKRLTILGEHFLKMDLLSTQLISHGGRSGIVSALESRDSDLAFQLSEFDDGSTNALTFFIVNRNTGGWQSEEIMLDFNLPKAGDYTLIDVLAMEDSKHMDASGTAIINFSGFETVTISLEAGEGRLYQILSD